MKTTRNLFAAAFVASLFLAACDRNEAPATNPLDVLTPKTESKTMPEAGHGNNHSSPALKKSTARGARGSEVKVLWI